MADKKRPISIEDLRAQRKMREKGTQSPNPTVPTIPRTQRDPIHDAMGRYSEALRSGDPVEQSAAAAIIYTLRRGTRGANIIAGLQTRHRAEQREQTKSTLRIVKDEQP